MDFRGFQPPLLPQESISDSDTLDTVFFDLETQNSFDEVGGRHNIEKLKVSVAVTYSLAKGKFTAYGEDQVQELLAELRGAGMVVGFNIREFDYRVLQPYAGFQLAGITTLDIMDHVIGHLGFRLSLDSIASATLGERKSADGLQAIRWFREGRIDDLKAYCQKDVEIVRKLYEFGAEEGYLLYFDRYKGKKRLPVIWSKVVSPNVQGRLDSPQHS